MRFQLKRHFFTEKLNMFGEFVYRMQRMLYLKIGIFPVCHKVAKVIALHKQKVITVIPKTTFRSLLSSLSNVFEKLLYNRMIQFLVQNDLFTPVQFGFRSNLSCVHAITEITDFIRDASEKIFTVKPVLLISEKF